MVTVKKRLGCLRQSIRVPRLTIKGLTNNTPNSQGQSFDWRDALMDAAIISGLTFFSSLGGGSVAGLSMLAALKAALVAACAQFFVFLSLKRGIVQPAEASV